MFSLLIVALGSVEGYEGSFYPRDRDRGKSYFSSFIFLFSRLLLYNLAYFILLFLILFIKWELFSLYVTYVICSFSYLW